MTIYNHVNLTDRTMAVVEWNGMRLRLVAELPANKDLDDCCREFCALQNRRANSERERCFIEWTGIVHANWFRGNKMRKWAIRQFDEWLVA